MHYAIGVKIKIFRQKDKNPTGWKNFSLILFIRRASRILLRGEGSLTPKPKFFRLKNDSIKRGEQTGTTTDIPSRVLERNILRGFED